MRILFILVLSLFSEGIFAQTSDIPGNDQKSISRQLQKIRWDMDFGAAYSFIPKFGGAMNYYASPGFTLPLTNKTSFHGGILTGFSSRTLPLFGEQNISEMRYGFTSIYGSVSYQVNPNVLFYGTGIKNIDKYGVMTPFSYNSFDEISIGSTIRLGNSITIGGSLHFRDYSMPGQTFGSPIFRY